MRQDARKLLTNLALQGLDHNTSPESLRDPYRE